MVDVTGLQVPPVPGVAVRVSVALGPTGVFVRVAVRVGVALGPTGVSVRVAVRVGVAVGPTGVFVRVAVRVGVALGPRGVLVRVGVGPPADVQFACSFQAAESGAVLGCSLLLHLATHSLLLKLTTLPAAYVPDCQTGAVQAGA